MPMRMTRAPRCGRHLKVPPETGWTQAPLRSGGKPKRRPKGVLTIVWGVGFLYTPCIAGRADRAQVTLVPNSASKVGSARQFLPQAEGRFILTGRQTKRR